MLTAYETVFIAPADIPTKRLDDMIEKLKGFITKPGGEIKVVDKWGRRRLAYPIHRHREGFYVFLSYKAPSSVPAEFTNLFKVSDDVIRHMTCIAPEVRPGKPRLGPPPHTGATAAPAAGATPAATATATASTTATQPSKEVSGGSLSSSSPA